MFQNMRKTELAALNKPKFALSSLIPTFSNKRQLDLALDKYDGSSMGSDGAKTALAFTRHRATEPI